MAQPQMLQISTEQLQQLVEAVRIAATSSANNATSAEPVKSKNSFLMCTARYNGERDREVVEEFITNATTYKEIEGITDEYALKTVSTLFCGLASTWWKGVQKEAKTWSDVIRLIREHFSPVKAYHQIYLEIFENKQEDDVPIDTFICEKRSLLAQLPEGRHDEETELDLVYGLLNIKYRKFIARDEVKTFKDLLEKGRIIEYNCAEDAAAAAARAQEDENRRGRRPKRCTFCNYRGHTIEQCRKKAKEDHDE